MFSYFVKYVYGVKYNYVQINIKVNTFPIYEFYLLNEVANVNEFQRLI